MANGDDDDNGGDNNSASMQERFQLLYVIESFVLDVRRKLPYVQSTCTRSIGLFPHSIAIISCSYIYEASAASFCTHETGKLFLDYKYKELFIV